MAANRKEHPSAVIIVNSCDAYSDLWDPFFLCMSEYWPECEYRVVLNTETKDYSPPPQLKCKLSTHHYRPRPVTPWGARLLSTLKDVNTDFVIVAYDDFLLNDYVNQDKIAKLLELMSSDPNIGVVYLTKLLDVPKTVGTEHGLARVAAKADYRLNSAPAIWRRDLLIKLTKPNDNPWAWEYFGSYRTFANSAVFLAIPDDGADIYPYDYRKGGAIYRGKWVSEVIKPIIDRFKLDLDLRARGTVKTGEFPKRNIAWKLSFVKTGFEMIGLRVFHALYRIIHKKAMNSLKL